jgi:hypothetical protein
LNVPGLEGVLAKTKADLEELLSPPAGGLSWTEMKSRLAQMPEVNFWMAKVWGERDARYRGDGTAFAQFLLLREFNRRPRRGNTVETMGLVRLRFPVIEAVAVLPDVLRRRPILGREATIEDWRGLLYVIIDQFVRAQFAIRADWNDLHWLHAKVPQSVLLPPERARRRAARRHGRCWASPRGCPATF